LLFVRSEEISFPKAASSFKYTVIDYITIPSTSILTILLI